MSGNRFYTEGIGFGQGAGGTASVGALLRQAGETDKGLYISDAESDESWHLRGVERTLAEEAVWASATYRGAGNGNSLAVQFSSAGATASKFFLARAGGTDAGRQDPPEIVNGYALNHFQYDAPDANGQDAFIDWGDLRVTSAKSEAAGNTDWFVPTNIRQRAARAEQNASANIPGSRGLVRGGDLFFRAPDLAARAASRIVRITSASTQQILITRTAVGAAGNGFRLLFEFDSSASAGNPNVTYITSGSGIDGILVGLRGSTTFTQIINAINAAVDNSNNKYVVAAGADASDGGSFSTSASFNFVSTTAYWPITKQSNGFGGGLEDGSAGGGGAVTNTGAVSVERGAVRVVGTGRTASASRFLGNLAFTVTFHEAGTDGNGWVLTLTGNSGGGTTVDAAAKTVAVNISGNLSYLAMKTAIDAIRVGGVQFFTASYNSGLDSQQAGNGSWRLAGGTEATTNPLTATYDDDTNVLTIVCLPTDTFDEVMDVVAALDEFQRDRNSTAVDGSRPGDVWLGDSATTLDTINPPANEGDSLNYDFDGGVDARARLPLVVIDGSQSPPFPVNNNTLLIYGYLPGDTVQDCIDAYTGSQFVLSSVSGDATTQIPTGSRSVERLSGGRGPIARQLPTVTLISVANGSAAYAIRYHGGDTPTGMRTTLAEMKAAWDDVQGADRPISPTSVVVTGDASVRVRNVNPPSSPRGGSNYVPATPIEALVRPDDETHGPNIEVRYHATEDTLQEIHDALQGQVDVVIVYGTDVAALPEAVGFVRSMFRAAGGGTSAGPSLPAFPAPGSRNNKVAKFDGDTLVWEPDATGSGQTNTFVPSKSNIYDAVKAIFHPATQDEVTADDTNDELDITVAWDDVTGKPTVITAAERAKLAGIAAGAEVNVQADWNASAGDALILNKPTLMSAETVRDTVAAFVRGGTNITINHNDSANTLTFNATAQTWASVTGKPAQLTAIPALPASGSRDNLILKFNGNTLRWEADAGGGTTVVANPSGAGTTGLTKLQVGNTIYTIAGSGGGEANVQADWSVSDTASDAFIKNKPTLYADANADARVRALVEAVALAANAGDRWPKSKIPSDAVFDADIADFLTSAEIDTAIEAELVNYVVSAASTGIPSWQSSVTYPRWRLVQLDTATYISIAASGNLNKRPGVASDWKTYWYRIGYNEPPVVPQPSAGGSAAGVESITNGALLNVGTQAWATLSNFAASPVVESPAGGEATIITARTTNSLTLAAGVYQVWFEGEIDTTAERAVPVFRIRNTADASQLTQSQHEYFRNQTPLNTNQKFTCTAKLILGAETTINVQAGSQPGNASTRSLGNIAGNLYTLESGVKVSFVALGGGSAAAGGGSGELGFTEIFSENVVATVPNRFVDTGAAIPDYEEGDIWAFDENLASDVLRDYGGLNFFISSNFDHITASTAGTEPNITSEISMGTNSPTGGIRFGKTAAGNLLVSFESVNWNPTPLKIYKVGRASAGPAPQPSISSFNVTGDLTPSAGSIAGNIYNYEYSIAQSGHADAVRIVGFAGTELNPSAPTVLKTITAAEFHAGSGSVTIPGGVSLTAAQTYTIRLEAYVAGQTPGTDAPTSYHDARIVAEAPATVRYTWGRLPRVANRTAAEYAAEWLAANATVLESDVNLDTAHGYSAVPAATGDWIFYLAARADAPQPTGWTTNSFNASSVFQDAVSVDFNSVTWNIYVMQDLYYRDADDGSQTYIPVL